MNFSSDNSSPVPQEIITSIVEANQGYQNSYGNDQLMKEVVSEFRRIFEHSELEVFLVATGTAANAIALASICPPWATIFCHQESHIHNDECGAPEFFSAGAKLTLLEGSHGKIKPCQLKKQIEKTSILGVHNVQRGALSLSNPTELGAVYTKEEIKELCDIANHFGMLTHMDGARFANALVNLSCTPAELSWKAGIDILSFGGTKNGLLGVEAVIIFKPEVAWEFELRRKRSGHLFSKHRYLSAQMSGYLKNELWLTLARKANEATTKLVTGLLENPHAEIVHPVDANLVFVNLPRKTHKMALANGAIYYLWLPDQSLEGDGSHPLKARLACNWSTKESEVNSLLELINKSTG